MTTTFKILGNSGFNCKQVNEATGTLLSAVLLAKETYEFDFLQEFDEAISELEESWEKNVLDATPLFRDVEAFKSFVQSTLAYSIMAKVEAAWGEMHILCKNVYLF